MGNQAGKIIRNVKNELFHSAKRLILNEVKGIGCLRLVVNEAASFGTPIVSTWGSGAAMEFIGDDYPQFLAKPADAGSL